MASPPQVIVVGGGPSGCLLALRLIRQGVRVCVIEQEEVIQPHFRALGYPGSTHSALQKAGIWEEANEKGSIKLGFSWRKITTDTGSEKGDKQWGDVIVNWDPYIDSSLKEGDVGYGMIGLPQNRFREIIMPKLLASELADVYLGYTMVDLSQNSDVVTVQAVNSTGSRIKVTAPFLVGADGSKSAVRKSLGLSLEGFTWPDIVIAVDAYLNLPPPTDSYSSIYIVDPKDYAFFSTMERPTENGRNLWRCTLAMSPAECEPDVFDDKLKEKLEKLTPGPRPLTYELLRAQPYRLHQRHTLTMHSGRCLLVGDAAHLTNPFGGLGLSTGILDADSVADALILVIKDGKPASILQTWADARLRIFKDIVSPTASKNKLRCHEADPNNPFADPFFRMIRDKDGDLKSVNEAYERMVTDMSLLVN